MFRNRVLSAPTVPAEISLMCAPSISMVLYTPNWSFHTWADLICLGNHLGRAPAQGVQ